MPRGRRRFGVRSPGAPVAGQFLLASGYVAVSSVLNVQPSTGSFSLIGTPGVTTSPPPFSLTLTSSDAAGYSLTERLPNQFGSIPNSDWSTDVWQQTGASCRRPRSTMRATRSRCTPPRTRAATPGDIRRAAVLERERIYESRAHLSLPTAYPGTAAAGVNGAFVYEIIGA